MLEFDDIRLECCKDVYCPREDSFILMDAVKQFAFGPVLDLGCGTGIQGITALKKGLDVTFADIDKKALECTKNNIKINSLEGKVVESNMFSSIDKRYNTIIFNPPYLISDKLDAIALDGGREGRHSIDIFLSEFNNYVLPEHIILLLESSLNNYYKDVKKYNAEIVQINKNFFETLVVLKFR